MDCLTNVARRLVYCSYKIFMSNVKARSPVTHGCEFEALATTGPEQWL